MVCSINGKTVYGLMLGAAFRMINKVKIASYVHDDHNGRITQRALNWNIHEKTMVEVEKNYSL